MRKLSLIALAVFGISGGISSCTQQKPDSFRLFQEEEEFVVSRQLVNKIDMLFMVDNSASMDIHQEKLRKGFGKFAETYLKKSDWDIQLAVVTSDMFVANKAYEGYLTMPMRYAGDEIGPGLALKKHSSYLDGRAGTLANLKDAPIAAQLANPGFRNFAAPELFDLEKRTFKSHFRYGDRVPVWGPDYAKLLKGVHDGPIPTFCWELNTYFYKSTSKCAIRDDKRAGTGVEQCLAATKPEDAVAQCVNTSQNDTVHTGKPVLKTRESSQDELVRDFKINVTVGASGSASERGLGSILQFLKDNEADPATRFFRPGSLRVLIFVSDEDDQTIALPDPSKKLTPTSLDISGKDANRGNLCNRTVGSYDYRLSDCPDPELLVPVADIKHEIDEFFGKLDQGTNSNYFVAAIVAATEDTVRNFHEQHAKRDADFGIDGTVDADAGRRYIELQKLVGNGSLVLDIGAEDYSPILGKIGDAVVERFNTFKLKRMPTTKQDMLLKLVHGDKSTELVPRDKWSVEGNVVTLLDYSFVLSLKTTDTIVVNYQPKKVETNL